MKEEVLVKTLKTSLSAAQDVCKKCPLKRKMHVPAEKGQRIVFVGEAPGETEVEKQRPFVGKTGSVLRETLEKYGFKNYGVTNTCLCRPTDTEGRNRAPTSGEVKKCGDFLKREISGYDWVVAVGGIAMSGLLKMTNLSAVLGEGLVLNDKRYFVIYHPSYIDRQGSDVVKEAWEKDIEFLHKLVYGSVDRGIVVTDDIEEVKTNLLSERTIFLDLETTGLEYGADIKSVAVAGRNKVYVMAYSDTVASLLKEILYKKKMVVHNALFELKFLLREKIISFDTVEVWDTMIMAFLADERGGVGSYKLKSLVRNVLNERYAYRILDVEKATGLYLHMYNGEDVYFTREIFDYYFRKMDAVVKWFCKQILFKSLFPMEEIQRIGMKLDLEKVNELKSKYVEKREKVSIQLRDKYGDLNLNSDVQIGDLIKEMGIVKYRKTPTGRVKVDEDSLISMKNDNSSNKRLAEFVTLLLEYRGCEKMLSTYLIGVVQKLDSDSRVRSEFSFITTATGRLASRSPNLQNIPRDSEVRDMFVSEDGYYLVEADASQVELRIAAHVANEKSMIEAFNRKEDLHTKTAKYVLGVQEITKKQRQAAKGIAFGFLYGMGWKSFREYAKSEYGTVFSDDEAKRYRERFFSLYPALEEWHKAVEIEVMKEKCIKSEFGRIRRLDEELNSEYEDVRAAAVRKAINFPVQSMASDVNLLLMSLLFKYRKQLDFKFVSTVHDSCIFEVRKEQLNEFLNLLNNMIIELNIMIKLRVEIDVEVKVGMRWGSLKEVDKC